MNPDNLATPLAASIGDVVSLSVLSFIASKLFEYIGKKNRSIKKDKEIEGKSKETSEIRNLLMFLKKIAASSIYKLQQ